VVGRDAAGEEGDRRGDRVPHLLRHRRVEDEVRQNVEGQASVRKRREVRVVEGQKGVRHEAQHHDGENRERRGAAQGGAKGVEPLPLPRPRPARRGQARDRPEEERRPGIEPPGQPVDERGRAGSCGEGEGAVVESSGPHAREVENHRARNPDEHDGERQEPGERPAEESGSRDQERREDGQVADQGSFVRHE
jgi:hypothetical protein